MSQLNVQRVSRRIGWLVVLAVWGIVFMVGSNYIGHRLQLGQIVRRYGLEFYLLSALYLYFGLLIWRMWRSRAASTQTVANRDVNTNDDRESSSGTWTGLSLAGQVEFAIWLHALTAGCLLSWSGIQWMLRTETDPQDGAPFVVAALALSSLVGLLLTRRAHAAARDKSTTSDQN